VRVPDRHFHPSLLPTYPLLSPTKNSFSYVIFFSSVSTYTSIIGLPSSIQVGGLCGDGDVFFYIHIVTILFFLLLLLDWMGWDDGLMIDLI